MTYPTLMAHLELGHSNAGLLRIVGDLAQRFGAAVIGVAATQPMRNIYSGYGDGYLSADAVQQDRDTIEKEMKEAEAEFRGALDGRSGDVEWRSRVVFGSPCDYLVGEARSADLVITGVSTRALLDGLTGVDTTELIMRAGRPVLVVPAAANTLDLDRMVIGWKDTRESRRAACDALPLLKKAAHVTVVQIAAKEDLAEVQAHLDRVVGWLKHHGIAAKSFAEPSHGPDSTSLAEFARRQEADIIVAGAYGHSRAREWALGGVTRDLLLRTDRCSLVSH